MRVLQVENGDLRDEVAELRRTVEVQNALIDMQQQNLVSERKRATRAWETIVRWQEDLKR